MNGLNNKDVSDKELKKDKVIDLSSEQEKKLKSLVASIQDILKQTDDPTYDEIFGYRINDEGTIFVVPEVRDVILCKFLAANNWNLEETKKNLIATLKWRKSFDPLSAAYQESFSENLDSMGILTVLKNQSENRTIVTWNLYGNLKSTKGLFDDVVANGNNNNEKGSQFLRWRIGLMERSLSYLDFTDPDNCKAAQIHDYKNVSMFKMDPDMKAATKQIISIFGENYPELLSIKFFLNVPIYMSWMFGFVKKLGIISAETLKKFQVQSNGDVSDCFGSSNLPPQYGGKGSSFESLEAMRVKDAKIPAYAGHILKLKNEKHIEDINISVE